MPLLAGILAREDAALKLDDLTTEVDKIESGTMLGKLTGKASPVFFVFFFFFFS